MNQSSKIKTVGIIGLGDFGSFLAGLIPNNLQILGYDNSLSNNLKLIKLADLQTVCEADIVILAVPLSGYDELLPKIKNFITGETLLIDVCSVKMTPKQLFAKYLPSYSNVLFTHPLFGPQSAAKNTAGHELIVTNDPSNLSDKGHQVLQFCEDDLKLKLRFMSAVEHDKAMAEVHALTFFIARGLANLNMKDQKFITPSFKMILDLIKLDKSQSEDLFKTVENGNPFAGQIRQDLLDQLHNLHRNITS